MDSIDVMLLNAWVNESGTNTAIQGMRNCIQLIRPRIMIPGHIQEMGHVYDVSDPYTRVPYEWAFAVDDEPMDTRVQVMAWGERLFLPVEEPEAPELYLYETSLSRPEMIKVQSSQDGVIFLVPEDTEKELEKIREAMIDSVIAMAGTDVQLPLSNLANGTYWLYATDLLNQISDPVSFLIYGVSTGHSETEGFKLTPNPVSHNLRIETTFTGPYSLDIYALDGRGVFRTKCAGKSILIDFSSFNCGTYLITIRSGDFVVTKKIIRL